MAGVRTLLPNVAQRRVLTLLLVPDLAFNEMRFLQKPKDHQDAVSGNQAAKGPTKKDRKHAQDEEISAYFAAQRRDPDGKQDYPSKIGGRQDRRKDSPLRARQASQPPVDLPEKPFLGFGSKGTQQDPSHKHDQSTSHYSWSESAAPARTEKGNAPILNAAFATERPGETESVTSKPKIASRDRASEKSVAQDESLDASWKRESLHQSQPKKRSTLRGTDVAPLSARLKDDEARRSTTKTTCQSLPHQIQETRSQDPPRSRGDMSCHTSDILKVRQPNTLITKSTFESLIGLAAVGEDDKENKQPDSSSPTGKLLKRARDALSQPTVTPVKIGQGHHGANAGLNFEDQLTDTGGLHMPERRLQYYRGDDTAFGQKGRQYQRPSLEQRIFRGPTRQQIGNLQYGMAEPLLRTQNLSSDAEMLDNGNDAAPLELYDSYVYADGEKNDKLGQNWQFERSTGFLDDREQSLAPVSRLSGGRIQKVPTLSDTGRARATRGLSIDIDNESSRPPTLGAAAEGGDTKIEDGFAGFWKPHRLY